ncbi:hypothetical Protein YC6258_03040 [Gynuella sunshinyii YC6258]|uniref:Uncharacterized protein n=1 Tax=Gynuella sunshinyii YC6258 TaxID=1445510 RepID=A0A0C5VNU4_9GAMM|nr:hypothetical Protein YC6258_03040 [Gynuella sunshinyii YC6258]
MRIEHFCQAFESIFLMPTLKAQFDYFVMFSRYELHYIA